MMGNITPGAFVKAFMKVNKIKQQDFADHVGMKKSNLCKYLNNKRAFTARVAKMFEDTLELDAHILMKLHTVDELSRMNYKPYTKFKYDKV